MTLTYACIEHFGLILNKTLLHYGTAHVVLMETDDCVCEVAECNHNAYATVER